jgi:magnesium-transporting ATPase (P-type)
MEKDLTYIGTFGLEDPIRDEIKESVNLIRRGVEEDCNYDTPF